MMKKMKRLIALLMTMAMVMGMGVTAFAAGNVTIQVTNAENATFKYVQVIRPNPKKVTGWEFVKSGYAQKYITAFEANDDQDAIKKLIENGDGSSSEVAAALSGIVNEYKDDFKEMGNPQDVNSAGIYAIIAEEAGYTYNNMAAYVGFGPVSGGTYPKLTSAVLEAKKTPTTVTKQVTDEDKVVAVGDILTYTIKTKVPYIDPNNNDRTFKITDTLTGAKYYLTGEGAQASIQMGSEQVFAGAEKFVMTNNSFSIDLSELILNNNANAGKDIIVTYTVKVTEVDEITNTAGSHISGVKVDSKPEVNVYTGTITLTKFDADNESKKLAGAGFEVKKAGSDEALTFTGDNGVYTYDPTGGSTEVFTGNEGTLVLKGLDLGTYNFKETTAPEGYHIANKEGGVDVSATLALGEGMTEATATVTAAAELANSKLSALPSTGGIGTTIFTIAGCAIMIAAAGLFFATRKRA